MRLVTEYRIFDLTLGIGTVLMLGYLVLDSFGYLDPSPYRSVRVVSAELSDENHLAVEISYTKTNRSCSYQRGQAFALLPGAREPVEFEPIRGAGQTSQRFPGRQMLRWNIDLNGWYPDEVEIWTRHDCEGQRVDRRMAIVEVPT